MDPAKLDQLIETYSQVSTANQKIFEKAKKIFTSFGGHGIDFMLLRGADLIPYLYGAFGLRTISDIDLLVHEKDLTAIDAILKPLGYRPKTDGNPAYLDSENIFSLDITTEIWYLASSSGVWERARQRQWLGVPAKGMAPEDLLLYLLAYETIYRGYFSKSFAKDIALLVEKESIDWRLFLQAALDHRLKIPVFHACSYVRQKTQLKLPDGLLESLAPSNTSGKIFFWILGRLVTEKEIFQIGHFLLFLSQPGRKRWARIKKTFFPSRAFFECRYGEETASRRPLLFLLRPIHLLIQALVLFPKILAAIFAPKK